MPDTVQQIKDRLNIVDVIGQYVKLTKAGKNYKGLSPFNKEKTPSFFVNPDKGMYYDFSSGQGGDIFSFVEKMEGLDFKDALRMLAEKAGVDVHERSASSRDFINMLYAVLEEATQYFETKLREDSIALSYLKQRGLQETVMRNFRIGYAPDAWRGLHEHLVKKGYGDTVIEGAGLIKKGDSGAFYDRFRSRIMFPILDPVGRIVAFSGRIHGEAAKDDKNAKYLNSPETQLFDKSRILYGFHQAKPFIRKYDFSILVEGQMDLVMSHQAGYGNTVAVSGTGLTEYHLSLVEKLSKKIVMAFDGDRAGIDSCGRAATLALRRGMDVKVALIPLGKDPADCIKEDASAWKRAVKDARHVVEFFLTLAKEEGKEKKWGARKLVIYVRDHILQYVAAIKSATDRAYFERFVASELGISEESVRDDVRTIAAGLTNKEVPVRRPSNGVPSKVNRFSRRTDLEKTLAGFLFMQDSIEHVFEEKSLETMSERYGIALEGILARYSDDREHLIEESNRKYERSKDPIEIIDVLMRDLAAINIADELEMLRGMQFEAEREHNDEELDTLTKRVETLTLLKASLE